MTTPNPCAAPRAAPPEDRAATYVPPGWRTMMAALTLVGVALSGFALHAMQARFGARTKDPKELAILLITGLAGLALLAMQIGAATRTAAHCTANAVGSRPTGSHCTPRATRCSRT